MLSFILNLLLYAQVSARLHPVEATVTCYTSEVSQTDASPFTTASGHRLKAGDKVVANNQADFGSKVLVNGVVYQVEDRMNKKYDGSYFDIWFEDKNECLKFGRRKMTVYLIK